MTTDETRSEHRHRRRHRSRAQKLWAGLRPWWVELLTGVFLALAIFLLVERMSIREQMSEWLSRVVAGAGGLVSRLAEGLATFAKNTTLSDLVAYGLILAVVVLLGWRQRQRLLSDPRRTAMVCPECGSELHRIHRHTLDRIIGVYVPVRRYQCKNHDCRWRGLRVKTTRYR